ncbi:SGNH/GDSL hydrolase family protein [Streptomyces sp. LX-29]|uniref:SGNH/GDSL hydrolase family protein n=1 Tax=Streptomyces sp. LX-29 TaxID=2900152 RepID=UPI00240D3E13|nr:SGNH/GDSL hydrolase family protein [Streptomyces sp. LX-29]WFB09277.1 SGNH/GDSL hydrolase family protein [Streptomyces sp. LX-29]
MPRRTVFALMAALAAVAVLVATAIFVGTGRGEGDLGAGSRGHRGPATPASAGGWVGSWSASPAAAEPDTTDGYAGMSIRNVVHLSVGGSSARIHLSNLYGSRPLDITHASLAVAAAPGTPGAAAGTMRRLTFDDGTAVTIPAGQAVMSDPVRLNIPDAADLLVTTYSPTPSGSVTYHPHARQTSYLAHGNRAADTMGAAYTEQSPYWRYLTAVDVWSKDATGAVAVLGDSITDGISSTAGTNRRWPDFLARRLREEPGAPRYGVLNQGISGNRVLSSGRNFPPDNPSALGRFDRDVLSRTGVKVVIIELGVNDILRNPHVTDPDEIVSGLRTLTRQAHARGLRVIGATLMPFEGHRGFTPELNAVREGVNAQIRSGKVFDSVVDFDAALRDPAHPLRLLPAYDSGDHLHPSDEGYAAMARSLNLRQLQGVPTAAL